jgi:transcriptional regulator with XRE-family HTH domain
MSLAQLADAANLSMGHLSSVENGRAGITIGTIAAVARGFGVPAMYVVTFPEEDPRAEAAELIRKLPKEQLKPFYRELKKSAKGAAKGGR